MKATSEPIAEISNCKCINCGNSVGCLYKKYSATVLKLTECNYCQTIADKYVEYDPVIVLIDLILLKPIAFRHVLLNTEFKNFWKLLIIILLLETYSNWLTSTKQQDKIIDWKIREPYLFESDIQLDALKFYKTGLGVLLSTFNFIVCIYSLTRLYTHVKHEAAISFKRIWLAVTVSSYGMFLLLPSLIWELHVHEAQLYFVTLYTTLSQLMAYRALCNCTKLWSLVVIFSSYIFKMYTTEFFTEIQLFGKM